MAENPFCSLHRCLCCRGLEAGPLPRPRQDHQAMQLHCQTLFRRPRGLGWHPQGNSGATLQSQLRPVSSAQWNWMNGITGGFCAHRQ